MLLSYTAVEFMQRFRFSSEQGALISALGDTTGGGPAPTIQLVWGPVAGGMVSSNCGTLKSEIHSGAPDKIIHTIGRLEYREGFRDVWVDDVHYQLRGHIPARLCLEYLVAMQAFSERTARHFLEEIEPYVREKGGNCGRGKFSEIKLKQYFNDRQGHLPKLRNELIVPVVGAGKYYLRTGV